MTVAFSLKIISHKISIRPALPEKYTCSLKKIFILPELYAMHVTFI